MASLNVPHGHLSPKYELYLMTLFKSSVLDRLRATRSTVPSPTRRKLVGIQDDHPRLRRLSRFILDHTAIRTSPTKDHECTMARNDKRVLKGMSPPIYVGDASGIPIYICFFEIDIDIMSLFLEPKIRTNHWCKFRRI